MTRLDSPIYTRRMVRVGPVPGSVRRASRRRTRRAFALGMLIGALLACQAPLWSTTPANAAAHERGPVHRPNLLLMP